MQPSDDMGAFQKVLRESKRPIAVAGAGLSAASGIGTFRGAGGFWRKYNAMELATPQAFKKNPSLVWQFYHFRREKALKAKPNAAHFALAELLQPSKRLQMAPNSMSFNFITQNVDGLSTRAMAQMKEEGKVSSEDAQNLGGLFEMHGRLFNVDCTSKRCGHSEFNLSSPICEALRGTDDLVGNDIQDAEIPLEKLPRCPSCHSLARPGVVWFGEMPWELDTLDSLVDEADLCLVIGTSSTVYPAAGYASQVQHNGGKIAVFNLDRSSGDDEADFLFLGPCEDTLPRALNLPD